jgi:hypothetical protein
MTDNDEIIVQLSSTILRIAEFEIEAASLEAIAEDKGAQSLEFALSQSSKSAKRGGAFGMEIAGAILVPVLVSAVKDFWGAYQKKMMEKLGASAAEATLDQIRKWFAQVPAEQQQADSTALQDAIRRAAAAKGIAVEDVDALVAAVASQRLPTLLVPPDT